MPLVDFLPNNNKMFNSLKNRLLIYVFCGMFIFGYTFDMLIIESNSVVYFFDMFTTFLTVVFIALFFFNAISIKNIVKIQILVLLANMVFSHFMNPFRDADFAVVFLRNTVLMFLLIPIYGVYCGKFHIFQIGGVYLSLYASSILRFHNHLLINNAPLLILSAVIYLGAVFFIIDTLEKLHVNQMELSRSLELQKDQLLLKNIDLEIKNKQIHEQSVELKQLLATKDKLFSIIGHDLRNPFNTVQGFVSLLKRNIDVYDHQKILQYIDYIEYSVHGSVCLLNNLLLWAGSQTGNIIFKPESYFLKPVVDKIYSFLNATARIKEITVNCFVDKEFSVFADENMLNTVLRNLLSNAIKYTDQGGRIDIYSKTKGDFTEIIVFDNGVGMTEERIASILQVEDLVSSPGTAGEKGTGLGLILCKDFIEKHGGLLSIESKVGEGSKFSFALPIAKTLTKYSF